MTTTELPCVPIWLAILVALAGAAVGGFFGSVAGTWMYPGPELAETGEFHFSQPHTTAGMVLGAGSGVAVAVGWSLLMRRMLVRAALWKIVFAGTGLGAAAGVVSTVVLHAGLMIVSHILPLAEALTAVLFFGAPAGVAVGLAVSLVALVYAVCVRASRGRAEGR